MLNSTRYLLFIFVIALSSIKVAAKPYEEALANWSNVLEQFVDNQGRTDFIALAKNTTELQKVVNYIALVSPDSNAESFPTKDHVLAYHINSYNALAMSGVIERGLPKDFNSFFKRASFFKFRKVIIGGKKTSLYDYENKVIRSLGEPRIHFALNCMVRDCPRLPQKPFLSTTLEQQLESVTKEFFTKEKHILIDHKKRTVHLSWILDYYIKDFVPSGSKKDLLAYVNNYLKQPIPLDYKVHFIKYNWTVNQQPQNH